MKMNVHNCFLIKTYSKTVFYFGFGDIVCQLLVSEARKRTIKKKHTNTWKELVPGEYKTKDGTDWDKKMSGLGKKEKRMDMVSHENEELGRAQSMQDFVSKTRLLVMWVAFRLAMSGLLALSTLWWDLCMKRADHICGLLRSSRRRRARSIVILCDT